MQTRSKGKNKTLVIPHIPNIFQKEFILQRISLIALKIPQEICCDLSTLCSLWTNCDCHRSQDTDEWFQMRLRFLFFQSHRFKTRCHGPRSGLDISMSSVSWVADYLSDTAPLGAPCVLWWLQGNPPGNFQLQIMFSLQTSDFISHPTCRRTPTTMQRLWVTEMDKNQGTGNWCKTL